MLREDCGRWVAGKKIPDVPDVTDDRIRSTPWEAAMTRYGLRVEDRSTFGGGGWLLYGGLVGRIVGESKTVDLYGKQTTRIHGMAETVRSERDHEYEFFLVVRPRDPGSAFVIKRWRFGPEDLAPTTDHFGLTARLTLDKATNTAAVKVEGLNRAFEERVPLPQ
jgi:hypothetical protein